MSYLTNPTSGLPPRGTILCIFKDSTGAVALERQFVNKGYTVLRARHGMHGYWLAISSKPDVVITDLMDPNQESDHLIDLLERNEKTSGIPVVAMVGDVRQTSPTKSCLGMVDVVLRSDAPVDEIVSELDALVESRQTKKPATADVSSHTRYRSGIYTRFDDYFARLGESELQRLRPARKARLTGRAKALPDTEPVSF